MLKSKRLLKLSRKGEISQNPEKGGSDLDDSIEDFIVSRPTKSERKQQKTTDCAQSLNSHPEVSRSKGSIESSAELSNSLAKSAASNTENSEKISPYFSEKESTDPHKAAPSTSRAVTNASKVTTRKKQTRKGSSRKGFEDPSDMALALALSESMQIAGEAERQKQEELLLTENLADVIADLRSEELDNENLAPIFLKSPPQPVTKVKRRGKNTKNTKDFVLVLRTQTERERLIAEQAAAVLNQAADIFKGEKTSFIYSDPNSEFIKQYQQKMNMLWRRTALVSLENTTDEARENFYVAALKSVLSPPKKPGCTKILFHLSQLPGRECSQTDSGCLTATQAVLEQLAYAAEGGFVDDPDVQNDQPLCTTPSELLQDWSRMIDNPLMSDVRIKTVDKQIYAHRLVFAVRFPQLLDHLTKSSETESFEMDWSDYSTSSAMKVLHFVYTAAYEHDESIAEEVCHICRSFGLRALSERIPNHEQYSFLSSESDAEDPAMPEDEKRKETTTCISEDSDSQKTVKLSITDDESLVQEHLNVCSKKIIEQKQSTFDSDIEELAPLATNHILSTINVHAHGLSSCVPVQSEEEAESMFIAMTPKRQSKDESSGSRSRFSRGSLSPDMFQETIYETKNSPSAYSDVIDLTQDSDRASSVCSLTSSHSPELRKTDFKKSDTAVLDPCAVATDVKETDEVTVCDPVSATFQRDSFLNESSFVLPASQDSPKLFLSRLQRTEKSAEKSLKNFSNLGESSFLRNSPLSITAESPPSQLAKSSQRFSQKLEQRSSKSKSKNSSAPSESLSETVPEASPEKPLTSSVNSFEEDKEILELSELEDKSSPASPLKNLEDSFSAWENCNDGLDPGPFYPIPGASSSLRDESPLKAVSSSCGMLELRQKEYRSTDHPHTASQKVPRRSQKSKASEIEDIQTPEIARLSKKRKVDITPLPNYQTMDTPGLKKELDKFGLKPMKRKNAVKLLNHIYEELHPYVTDSECSSQDSPKRAAEAEANRRQSNISYSPSKIGLDRSSQESSENSLVEDEESILVTEMDRRNSHSPSSKGKQAVPLADQMKQFFQKRPELYKQVLIYEPIEFEFLYKEARKDGVRCKAQELLNWLDEQCITCRMNPRNNSRKGKSQSSEALRSSPDKILDKQARPTQGSRVAKKLIS